MPLNDEVQAAVARWREIEEPCPVIGRTTGFHYQDVPETTPDGQTIPKPNACGTCAGTGYVQPAIVKALIEAVTVPCTCYPGFNYCHDSSCCCDDTDRVPRDWEEMPGALEGIIKHSVREALGKRNLSSEEFFLSQVVTNSRGDSDTLAAVDKALKQMYGGKSK